MSTDDPTPPQSPVPKELMRRLSLFADLSDEDLQQLYDMAGTLDVSAGEWVIEEGAPGDALYILLDGEVEVTKRDRNREVVLATRGPGEFLGEFSLIEQAPRSASVRALRDSHLLVVSQAAFQTLLTCSPAAPQTILRTMTSRLRSTEALVMQQQKLASLGTMAAGLAHELNNPAAAIRRGSAHLREALGEWERAAAALGTLALDTAQVEALDALRERLAQPPPAAARALDTLARSEREDDLQEWLEEQGIVRGWEVAPVLVAAGWSRADLGALAARFTDAQLPALARWLAAGASVYGLVDEVSKSARAISEIVHAAKSYSYLDQAPVQAVDVHESLETTLVIMRHKLGSGVRVEREYAPELPHIEAYGSELNQVWTNLIDNAIDAMQGQGELRLRTDSRGDAVVVEVIDSGSGIPPEIQPRIFDPFFTTKPPGQGTGLGLHLAHNIVTQRHRGQLEVESRPGETCFRVTLPVRLARDSALPREPGAAPLQEGEAS